MHLLLKEGYHKISLHANNTFKLCFHLQYQHKVCYTTWLGCFGSNTSSAVPNYKGMSKARGQIRENPGSYVITETEEIYLQLMLANNNNNNGNLNNASTQHQLLSLIQTACHSWQTLCTMQNIYQHAGQFPAQEVQCDGISWPTVTLSTGLNNYVVFWSWGDVADYRAVMLLPFHTYPVHNLVDMDCILQNRDNREVLLNITIVW